MRGAREGRKWSPWVGHHPFMRKWNQGKGRAPRLVSIILDGCVAAHSCKTHDGTGGKGQTTLARGNRVLVEYFGKAASVTKANETLYSTSYKLYVPLGSARLPCKAEFVYIYHASRGEARGCGTAGWNEARVASRLN